MYAIGIANKKEVIAIANIHYFVDFPSRLNGQ